MDQKRVERIKSYIFLETSDELMSLPSKHSFIRSHSIFNISISLDHEHEFSLINGETFHTHSPSLHSPPFSLLLSLSKNDAIDDDGEDLSFLEDDDDDTNPSGAISPPKGEDSDELEDFDDDFGGDDDFDESQFGDEAEEEYSIPEVDEKDVVVLKERNFTDVIEENKYVWLSFMRLGVVIVILAPEYAAAATQLKSEGVNAVLAKVDATEENELAHQFDVQGFPTVLFFIDGEHKVYNGQRTKDAIVTWIKKKTGPSVYNITTTEEAEEILTANEKGPESDQLAAASRLEDEVNFYQTVEPNVAKLFHIDAKAKRPALVLLKKDVEKFNHFGESGHYVDLILFATSNDSEKVLPLFQEASKPFKGKITVDTDRTVVAFYKFLKKHAAIPFKLSKPASDPKAKSSDPIDFSKSSDTKDVKDEL
ncbi:Protein disulfide isomerase-like 1-4 [Bienertia sinuspersici]